MGWAIEYAWGGTKRKDDNKKTIVTVTEKKTQLADSRQVNDLSTALCCEIPGKRRGDAFSHRHFGPHVPSRGVMLLGLGPLVVFLYSPCIVC